MKSIKNSPQAAPGISLVSLTMLSIISIETVKKK